MPELAELLREAAGSPEVPDLATAMRRRRRRRNRRRVVGAVVALAALTGVGFTSAGRDGDPQRTVARPPADEVEVHGQVIDVADDGTTLWVATRDGQRYRVERFDDRTGERLDPIVVDEPIWAMELAGGAVWLAGRDPMRQFRGGIVRVDTATGAAEQVLEWGEATGLIGDVDLAWDGRMMWATDGHGEVDGIELGGEPVRIPVDGQPGSIAAATSGIWVELDGDVGRVDVAARRVGVRHRWGGEVFASSGDAVWSTDDGHRAVELYPENLGSGISVSLGDRYGGGDVELSDVIPTSDGVWLQNDTSFTHWSRGAARPDRVLRGKAMAVSTSGIWVADRTGGIVRRRG
jgi:hypothetical protein